MKPPTNSPPDDPQIRQVLRVRLAAKHSRDRGAVLLEELGLERGQARVDLAVVNGSLHGYEIKSDRDSLRRLPDQIAVYGRVLDRMTVVAGEQQVRDLLEIVPSWWGLLVARVTRIGLELSQVRPGRKNTGQDARSLVELLWLEEALGLLESRGVARGVRGAPRSQVWDRVCEYFTSGEIGEVVRLRLKARAAQRDLWPLQ